MCLLATAEHSDFSATHLQPLVDPQHGDSGDQMTPQEDCSWEVHMHNLVTNQEELQPGDLTSHVFSPSPIFPKLVPCEIYRGRPGFVGTAC